MISSWTFAGMWEQAAAAFPAELAAIHGQERITWAEFDRRANSLAAGFLELGLPAGSKVALYLPNRPEYMESFYAAAKVSLVPVNTNFRYLDDELVYLWENADAEAVVFDVRYAAVVERVRHRVPGVSVWIQVGSSGERATWATPYEELADRRAVPAPGKPRSDDDLILLYTGGTTGRPKGVMWRQGDVLSLLNAAGSGGVADHVGPEEIAAHFARRRRGKRALVACPLMHGSGLFVALSTLNAAGCVVTLPSASFDAVTVLDTLERESIQAVVIVGDAFARPLLEAVEAEPGRWSLPKLRLMSSSGAMWSATVKRRWLDHFPQVSLIDGLGSSEAGRIGSAVATAADVPETSTFAPSDEAAVLLDDGSFARAGSGDIGLLAVSGWLPLGYYKDEQKTAEVFRTVGGRRWSVPGDLATVGADGRIRLLGRGSGCINTAGEKVFPEEVEETMKTHPQVADAAVVGVADDRFGQVVVALVESRPGSPVVASDLLSHVKGLLAGYKAPKHIEVVDTVDRGPNGKLDYGRLRERATAVWGARG